MRSGRLGFRGRGSLLFTGYCIQLGFFSLYTMCMFHLLKNIKNFIKSLKKRKRYRFSDCVLIPDTGARIPSGTCWIGIWEGRAKDGACLSCAAPLPGASDSPDNVLSSEPRGPRAGRSGSRLTGLGVMLAVPLCGKDRGVRAGLLWRAEHGHWCLGST